MVCKAYVESKVGKYKVKVRIPALHRQVDSIGAVPTIDIPQSTMCVPPGIYPSLRVGDCLWVDFEDDNIDKPVVMGVLYTDNTMPIRSDIVADSLTVDTNAKLPTETSIGKVSSKVISYLIGLKSNLQDQLDDLMSRCKDLAKRVLRIETDGCGEVNQFLTIIDGELNTYITNLTESFDSQQSK
jgi:hypothetical protein